MLDPRIQTLIDSVRHTHVPIWRYQKDVSEATMPWCCGCKGLVFHDECPVMAAADELELEDGYESGLN
jgi:hypothetical protein